MQHGRQGVNPWLLMAPWALSKYSSSSVLPQDSSHSDEMGRLLRFTQGSCTGSSLLAGRGGERASPGVTMNPLPQNTLSWKGGLLLGSTPHPSHAHCSHSGPLGPPRLYTCRSLCLGHGPSESSHCLKATSSKKPCTGSPARGSLIPTALSALPNHLPCIY